MYSVNNATPNPNPTLTGSEIAQNLFLKYNKNTNVEQIPKTYSLKVENIL